MRRRMTRRGSRSYFSATAAKANSLNFKAAPMRGGWRL